MQLAVKLRHALAEGYAAAENSLGQLAQTYTEAVRLYQLAADQGNVDAQSNLGYLYYDGRGVEQSYAEAARFFKLAADQGDGYAQYYLALLYENGQGCSSPTPRRLASTSWLRIRAMQMLSTVSSCTRPAGGWVSRLRKQ